MTERRRRFFAVLLVTLIVGVVTAAGEVREIAPPAPQPLSSSSDPQVLAATKLSSLQVKGRAPRTGYSRAQFGNGWGVIGGCDVRNLVLQRDLTETNIDPEDNCSVLQGTLDDPYTGKTIEFRRGSETSQLVQIDHVVALSDAWQKGAQGLSAQSREAFANDPLNLLAVDGPTNVKKSDGDAATWLPPNKTYRCRYVARQIAVKVKYALWVTSAELEAIKRVLDTCPAQQLPIIEHNEEPTKSE